MISDIKVLIELVTQLDASIKDRKTREQLLPIREKILQVQSDMFDQRQAHVAEIEALKAQHARELDALKAELAARDAQRPTINAEFSDKTGTHVDKDSGLHYCPKCWNGSTHRAVPMQDNGHGWTCGVCGKKCADPKRPIAVPKIGIVHVG